MREKLDTSQERIIESALEGLDFPLDDEDYLKIERETRDSWFNDNNLLKYWGKIENSLLTCFSLAGSTKLLGGLISRDQYITGRSVIPFILAGWLSTEDAKNIESVQQWALTILKNRPDAISTTKTKDVDRDAPVSKSVVIRGSILTIPPAPQRGEDWLKGLIQKAEALVPKMRNCEKRLGRRQDIKLLFNATDPNRAMRDKKEPYKAPMPAVPNNKFITGYA